VLGQLLVEPVDIVDQCFVFVVQFFYPDQEGVIPFEE
jgi:hypothetical protein